MAEIRFNLKPVHVGLAVGVLAVVVVAVVLLLPRSSSTSAPQQPVPRPLTSYEVQMATERAIANQRQQERMHKYLTKQGPFPLP